MAEPVSSTGPSSSSQGHRPDSSKTVSIPANTSRGSFALSVSSMSLPDALPDTDDEILSTAPSSTYTSLKDSFRSKEYARSCLGHGRELAHDRREEICLHAGCRRPFTRSFDLNRHVRTHFPATAQRFDCPKGPGGFCGRIGERAFTRQDHLDEHLRKVHLVNIPRSARGSREERAENQPAEATSKENTEEGNVTAISGTRMKDSAGKLGTNQSAGSISSYRNNDEAHSQKEWQPSAMALDDESQPETLVESHQNENSPKISDESKETTGSGKEVIDTVDRSKIIDQPRLIVRLKIPKDLRKACLQILDMQPRPNIIPRQSIDQRKPSVEDASSALQMRHSQHQPIAQGKALKDQDVKPERTTSASTHYRSPWRLETWLAEVQRNLLAKQRPRKPHQRVASKQLEIYCPVCSTSFIAFGELRAHLITEHELQLYFWCPTQGCIEPVHRTPDSLLDHRYEEHQLPTSEIDSYFEECCSQRRIYRCLGENCNIGNLQTDDLLKHLYEKHGGAEPETKKAQPTGFTIIPRTDTWKRTSSAIVMLNYLLEDHSTAQEGTWTDYLYDSIAPTTITRPEPRSEAISTIVKVYLAIRITGAAQNATLSVVLAVLLVVWIWYMATVEFKMLLGSFLFQCVSSLANATLAEPPVAAGKTRIHWTCACGSRLYDDFVEVRPGAARELMTALDTPSRQSASGQPPTSKDEPSPAQTSSIGAHSSSAIPHAGSRKVNTRRPVQAYDLPINGGPTSTAITSDPECRWLLICAQAWQRPTSLRHLDVCSTTSDQQLFTELRQLYLQLKKAWRHRFSLKLVKSIRYIQFELHPQDLVDIRKVPDMPPESRKGEYLYQDCDLLPPIGENLMTHLFHHPHEANEKAITFLRSPKKRKQKLVVCPRMGTNVGWGIHLVEGWAMTKIWLLTLTIFLLGSLIFAIAWSVLEHDLQGAFGVAAYFVALAGLGIGTVQAYINQL